MPAMIFRDAPPEVRGEPAGPYSPFRSVPQGYLRGYLSELAAQLDPDAPSGVLGSRPRTDSC